MGSLILFSAGVVLIYMTIWWLIALKLRRNDIADVAWGLGFVVLAVTLYLRSGTSADIKTIIMILMVMIWGIRLAAHIAWRHHGKPEDGRYQAMRATWRYPIIQSYIKVFLSQGFFLLLVASPVLFFFYESMHALRWFNLVGVIIWLIGFLFEAIGDYQLAKFIKNPAHKGKIMRYGLWQYSRHPNYFGEISLWWGFYLFTFSIQWWYLSIIGPIAITYLIIGVSGIPLLERRYKDNREYQDYKASTSVFFPLPRKNT